MGRNRRVWTGIALVCTLSSCEGADEPEMADGARLAPPEAAAPAEARFAHFTYSGRMPQDLPEAGRGEFRNPVLQGFYPDPSVTKAGDRYYLVNSTFGYFPGIPVFESTDLVSWRQIGNVIDRPGMLDFSGLGLSRGVFAPTIEFEDGTFYVLNTCVDCGGNFIVTSDDPAGPWSEVTWLPEVGGIDPSIFFDSDGKVYIINNDAPEGTPRYEGHRAIWIRQVDPETFQSISEPTVLLDGGVRPEENPVWIEGPHIYRIGGTYYLWAAEGGTSVNHSQVVLTAEAVTGPYTPYKGNPILTQRHLPADRDHPITATGHADLVTDSAGNWWATFLAIRPNEEGWSTLGRETFAMPVHWRDGWPMITEGDDLVPFVLSRPAGSPQPVEVPMSGPFTLTEEFDQQPGPHWMMVRTPSEEWMDVNGGDLVLTPRTEKLGQRQQPSVLVRRIQHMDATAETEVRFQANRVGDEAGLVAMQSDHFYYKLGAGVAQDGSGVITLRQRAGEGDPALGTVVATAPLPAAGPVALRFEFDGPDFAASWRQGEAPWRDIGGVLSTYPLSTEAAGGFVGATVGVYAEAAAR